MNYVLSIDQSTQGTKAVLMDENGHLVKRADKPHRQIVSPEGWVSHNPEEIYQNLLFTARTVILEAGVSKSEVAVLGISNQRETTVAWDRKGKPLADAVVWQCARARNIAAGLQEREGEIREKTGLPLSPFFPAAKMAWLLKHEEIEREAEICLGTVDSWLIYQLTKGQRFATDYSNASRTQLFNIHTLKWDEGLCRIFGVPQECLPEVCPSDSCFGFTDLDGFLPQPIPIYGVLGDSHAALFAQGCHREGMVKATYGTGSSIMMHTGKRPIESGHGLAASLAWCINGEVSYVLEGNINYTGAVISWLKDEMGLIASTEEVEEAAMAANPLDTVVLVPAFTGLSAPWWDEDARAMIYGMCRTTGRCEIIRAALESIAYQITDVLKAMEADSKIILQELRVDGGPTRNDYLMQFQSDITGTAICVPKQEELSAIGAAYLAGISAMIYNKKKLFTTDPSRSFFCRMGEREREEKYRRWQQAVELCRKK